MNKFGKDVDPRIMYLYEPTREKLDKIDEKEGNVGLDAEKIVDS